MDYISVRQAAEKWGVTMRQVQLYLKDGRVDGALRPGHDWLIPAGAEKPVRVRGRKPPYSLKADLAELIARTTLPMPQSDPLAILDTISDERLRLHYEAELAYLRSDFELTKQCYLRTEGDDASRIRVSSIAIAAAISTGDYSFYTEIDTFLKEITAASTDDSIKKTVELIYIIAYVSTISPNMCPEWMKKGDFSSLLPQTELDAAFKRAKYFQCLGQFENMLAVAQTALIFCDSRQGITFFDIYLRIVCAIACCALRRIDEAKRWLKEAMVIALPHGFVTPFAESATAFGGLLEPMLEQFYPEYYGVITDQWQRTFPNRVAFHNLFTKHNIRQLLSMRDYQIALLVAQGIPYKNIAEQFNIAIGTLNNKMQVIYDTLCITGKRRRKELRKYLL